MMNKRTYYNLHTLLLAGALLAPGCSHEETEDFYALHPDAVRFDAGIGDAPRTRVNTEGNGTTFNVDDKIGISADNGATYTTYELPAQGENWTPAAGSKYLKWYESTMSFKAYYPVTENTSCTYFEVPSGQETTEKLQLADYMLAEAKDQASGSPVSLKFRHQLAKVTVTIKMSEELAGSTIRAVGVNSYGNIIENGTITNPNLLVGYTPYPHGNHVYTALLPPQEATNMRFVQIDTKNPAKIYYLKGIPKLEAGKAYTLNVQVGHDGVKLDGQITVEEWSSNQYMTLGEAILNPKVGDFYYKDGTWSTENRETVANPVIGVVFEVSGNGHGKVVSLQESEGEWSTISDITNATSNDGKTNTDLILKACNSAKYQFENYPIFKACNDLRSSTGNIGWYIPVDYDEMFTNINKINTSLRAKGVTELVAPMNEVGTTFYWTSNEVDANEAYVLYNNHSVKKIQKNENHRVRFVLDF